MRARASRREAHLGIPHLAALRAPSPCVPPLPPAFWILLAPHFDQPVILTLFAEPCLVLPSSRPPPHTATPRPASAASLAVDGALPPARGRRPNGPAVAG